MMDGTRTKRKQDASQDDFRRLLARLDPNPGLAWQSYETLRQKLTTLFEQRYPLYAEELAEEALDRIAKKSASYEIANVTEFAFGIARNLRKETFRRASTRVEMVDSAFLNEDPFGKEDPEDVIIDKIDSQQRLRCFLKCMQRLEAEDRRALFQYYPLDNDDLEGHRRTLAQKLRINAGALRTRMTRLRDRLERCFEGCCGQRKVARIDRRTVKRTL